MAGAEADEWVLTRFSFRSGERKLFYYLPRPPRCHAFCLLLCNNKPPKNIPLGVLVLLNFFSEKAAQFFFILIQIDRRAFSLKKICGDFTVCTLLDQHRHSARPGLVILKRSLSGPLCGRGKRCQMVCANKIKQRAVGTCGVSLGPFFWLVIFCSGSFWFLWFLVVGPFLWFL